MDGPTALQSTIYFTVNPLNMKNIVEMYCTSKTQHEETPGLPKKQKKNKPKGLKVIDFNNI